MPEESAGVNPGDKAKYNPFYSVEEIVSRMQKLSQEWSPEPFGQRKTATEEPPKEDTVSLFVKLS